MRRFVVFFHPHLQRLLTLALIGTSVLMGDFGCARPTSARGITLLVETPADSYDDRFALTAVGQRLASLVAPGLMTFDDQSEPVPDLAESFMELDERTYEFRLRPNLTFHDGTPLTADDVKATYEGVKNPAFKSPKRDKYAAIAAIEAPDARTVRFHLKEPYAPLLAELTLSIVPQSRALDSEVQGRAPIGAGPFRFASAPDEDHLELLPFAGYYRGIPQISALHVRVVRDETTRVLELLKGRADLVNGLSPSVLPALQQSPKVRILSQPGTGYAYLAFNLREGPLADPRVRRAVCHALNVPPILAAKFHGQADAAMGMLPRTNWAYAPTQGCHYDPTLAKQLLDEAGFRDPDGDGPQPRLHLSYKTSTDRFRRSLALVIQDQLAQVGIETDVRALEFGTFFSDVRKGNFELISLKWAAVMEPDLLRQVFSSSAIPSAKNQFAGFNRGGYRNAAVDAWLNQATLESKDVRKKLYADAQQAIDADLPYVPLWHEHTVAAVSIRLSNFEPSPQGFLRPLERAVEVNP